MPDLRSFLIWLPGLVVATAAPAQTWVQRTTAHAPPAQAFQPSLAYHRSTQRVVLHGGRSTTVLADTWTYDGVDWTLETPQRTPGQRWGHRMAYHDGLDFVVLFGGQDGRGVAQNDTWIWNGTNWGQIVTRNSPSPRAWHQMAYDVRRDRVVVWGGFAVTDQRTWEFDGTEWHPVTTAHVPPRVSDGEMVYDTSRGVCVLFGGFDVIAGGYAGTWEYDGADWRQFTNGGSPAPRTRHQMSYDTAHNHVVMHGGLGGNGELRDTWTFDGTAWRAWIGAGRPTHTVEGGMTYDVARGAHVYFGGRAQIGLSANTFEYTSIAYPGFAASGAGCAGSAGVPRLTAVAGSVPRSGTPLQLQVTNAPTATPAVIVMLGWSNTSIGSLGLPLDMSFVGLPGCHLETSADVTFAAPAALGTARFSLAIPATLTAGTFWVQAFVPDAVAGNPGRATLSNACRATIAP